MWQSNRVRSIVPLVAALLGAGVVAAPPASAGPTVCDYPACTPGIMPHQVLGAPCDNTHLLRLRCRRRLRLLRLGTRTVDVLRVAKAIPASMVPLPAHGWVKEENADCTNYLNYVAQAPDGLFLICIAHDGISSWVRADT